MYFCEFGIIAREDQIRIRVHNDAARLELHAAFAADVSVLAYPHQSPRIREPSKVP